MSNEENVPWQRFRRADTTSRAALLDPGRAQLMFERVVLPDLTNGQALNEFVSNVYGASGGDPEVLVKFAKENPDIVVNTVEMTPQEAAEYIVRKIMPLK